MDFFQLSHIRESQVFEELVALLRSRFGPLNYEFFELSIVGTYLSSHFQQLVPVFIWAAQFGQLQLGQVDCFAGHLLKYTVIKLDKLLGIEAYRQFSERIWINRRGGIVPEIVWDARFGGTNASRWMFFIDFDHRIGMVWSWLYVSVDIEVRDFSPIKSFVLHTLKCGSSVMHCLTEYFPLVHLDQTTVDNLRPFRLGSHLQF